MNLPPAAVPALAVGGVALGSHLGLRLVARLTAGNPPKKAMGRIRVALGVGLPLAGLAALVAAVLGDALALTEAGLRAVSPALADSAVGAVLTWVPTLAGVVVAVVAGYLGTFPYLRELRDVEMSAAEASARLARWVGVLLALVVVLTATVFALPADAFSSTLPALGVLAAVTALGLAAQPILFVLVQTTRAPTDAERDRLDRLAERAGASPRAVRVFEIDGDPTATASLAGVPGRRHLFVTDHLLEEFDDDEVAAVLASEAGRAKCYYMEYKLVVILLAAVLLLGAILGDIGVLAGLGTAEFAALFVGVLAALAWGGQRLVLAADDYAVERVGADTYAETLEAIADEHQLRYESNWLVALARMRPSLGERLDRLWGRPGE